MAAGLLSGLLPNMMVGADQAIGPIQQVLEGKQDKNVQAQGKGPNSDPEREGKRQKSKRECEREKRRMKQHQTEEMIRKLILIFLLFLLLFIVIMALFALGHHARWQASLLPDKTTDSGTTTVT